MHYTPAQTRWFLSAIERAESEQSAASRVHHVVDTRVASLMDGKDVAKHITSIATLGKDTHG